jgi:hypothetical protein
MSMSKYYYEPIWIDLFEFIYWHKFCATIWEKDETIKYFLAYENS